MKRYFYWYRSPLGRWCPAISEDPPGRGADRAAPKLAFSAVELTGVDLDLSLNECCARWPVAQQESML